MFERPPVAGIFFCSSYQYAHGWDKPGHDGATFAHAQPR
jgi:hypothetical protein